MNSKNDNKGFVAWIITKSLTFQFIVTFLIIVILTGSFLYFVAKQTPKEPEAFPVQGLIVSNTDFSEIIPDKTVQGSSFNLNGAMAGAVLAGPKGFLMGGMLSGGGNQREHVCKVKFSVNDTNTSFSVHVYNPYPCNVLVPGKKVKLIYTINEKGERSYGYVYKYFVHDDNANLLN